MKLQTYKNGSTVDRENTLVFVEDIAIHFIGEQVNN
jgi:hypothetical protein